MYKIILPLRDNSLLPSSIPLESSNDIPTADVDNIKENASGIIASLGVEAQPVEGPLDLLTFLEMAPEHYAESQIVEVIFQMLLSLNTEVFFRWSICSHP